MTNTIYLINDVIGEGKNVLIEGANAVMLDFDLGEYQYELTTVWLVGLIFCGLETQTISWVYIFVPYLPQSLSYIAIIFHG